MPKLVIDNQEIEVPKGTKVIEAAERLGIIIPRFCYHPGLGSVGACRLCAVKFLEGPVKGIQMSCMTEAVDGMSVSTTDEEAVDFRKQVIEWLMLNHPHDCPVCDEGGHCLLQDMTVSGGHAMRRYLGNKRTYRDQTLGPFVQHEMNRCIHCWRCRRFYQEFSGYRDLGAMQIGHRTFFGRFNDGPLESPFSGNLIDLCPTGVYTDKPSRFKGRRWDYQRGPSVCPHCSLGCLTIPSARYREIVRIEGRFSEAVNGYFICDRGRYGFDYTNHPERPRQARVSGKETSVGEAVREAARILRQTGEKYGSSAIAAVGSPRCSIESLGMLNYLSRTRGWREPHYFIDSAAARKTRTAVSQLNPKLAVSMREIEKADFVLLAGADPLNEAPMLALALRQASRKGATITVIDPRPVSLPLPFIHLPVSPGTINPVLSLLVKNGISRSDIESLGAGALPFYDSISENVDLGPGLADRLSGSSQKLRLSRSPVIVCGTDVVGETTVSLAGDLALLLQASKGQAGLFHVMAGANAFGAALLSSGNESFLQTVEAIEKGSIRALLLVECDPFPHFPDGERLKQAFDQLESLVVLDYLPSRVVSSATGFIPTRTLFETDAALINQEGRIQHASIIHHGGVPIDQLTGGEHPPRVFRGDVPGGEPLAAWQILAELARELSGKEETMSADGLWNWLSQQNAAFAGIVPGDGCFGDSRIRFDDQNAVRFAPERIRSPERTDKPGEALGLLMVDWIFGTEELSTYSKHCLPAEKEPCLFMNEEDAARMGLSAGDEVLLNLEKGPLEVRIQAAANMAPGIVLLPRHRQLSWQKLKTFPAILSPKQISRK
jgi:NADH-quinone oxidoreductase subunit G